MSDCVNVFYTALSKSYSKLKMNSTIFHKLNIKLIFDINERHYVNFGEQIFLM